MLSLLCLIVVDAALYAAAEGDGVLMADDFGYQKYLEDAGLYIDELAWPISDNSTDIDNAWQNGADLSHLATKEIDLGLGYRHLDAVSRTHPAMTQAPTAVHADIINATMIAILTSSDLPPAPVIGATSGGSTAVGMIGIHPILRSLLSEGENLQALWPFTETSPQQNYSGFGTRRNLVASDMKKSSPGLKRPCGQGAAQVATGSVSAQAGMGWGLGSVQFEPRSAVHIKPVQSGYDGWVLPLDDGRFDPHGENPETPEVYIEMWVLRLRNSLVSSTPFNMACGYLGYPSGQTTGYKNWNDAQLTFFLPSCIRQNFMLNISDTFRPIPSVGAEAYYDRARGGVLPPQDQQWTKKGCEVQVCDSSLSALKWHHVLYWQDRRTTMPQILLDSGIGAGWNGSDCMHCRCDIQKSDPAMLGQCGRCTHDTRMVPNPLTELKPDSGIVFGGTFNQVAFGAFQFVSFLRTTSPRRLSPQFAPRLPPVGGGHWVIRNTSLEGYFEGRPTAYVRCNSPGLVAVGTPGGRTWLGSWSGPAWEGTPELDADRAVVADSRRRAAAQGTGLPLRYRFLPSYLEDTKGDNDPNSNDHATLAAERGFTEEEWRQSWASSADQELPESQQYQYGDYAQTYRLPWANPRCVEPWGSDSPWREDFHRHGIYSWSPTHEEYAVITMTLQVDPSLFPPGSPQGDTLANKLRVEVVDLISQIESSRIAVFLERSSKLAKRSPPGMLAIVHIYPSNQPAPASGALGEDDDLPVTYDDDAGRITAEGGATVQNSPRMVAYQLIDLFASPSDSILADTLALAQRYPDDSPRPELELLPRCRDGTFARVCSATWVFSRGFIGLVCFFTLSWGMVFLGRCCIDDSGIIADPQARLKQKVESRESGAHSARASESRGSEASSRQASFTGAGGAAAHAAGGSSGFGTDPRVNYDDEMDGKSGSAGHVLAGYSLGVDDGAADASQASGGIAASGGTTGGRGQVSSSRDTLRSAGKPPPAPYQQREMPVGASQDSMGPQSHSDSLGGIELPSADTLTGPPGPSGTISQPMQEGVMHGGSLTRSGDIGSINSAMWRSGEGGSMQSDGTVNRMIQLRSRPLTRTSNIVVPAFGVVAMGCIYLQMIILIMEQQRAAWIIILAALCLFAVENTWYATVRHYILVVEDTSKDAKLSKWYSESVANRVVYWIVTVLSIFFGPTTCMILQSYWRRWEVFSMPLTMSRNAPEAYPDVLRRHSSIPAVTSVGPTFVIVTLRVIGVFPPPPPGWPAMVTLAVLFLYFVFTIVSAYLARLDLRLDEQYDPDRREMTQGFARYVSEDSRMRSRLSDGTPPQANGTRKLPELGPTLPAAAERPMGMSRPPDPLGYGDSEGPPVSESDGAIGETAAVGVRPDRSEVDDSEADYAPPRPTGDYRQDGSSRGRGGQDYSTPGLSYAAQSEETSAYFRSEAPNGGADGRASAGGRPPEGAGSTGRRTRGRVEDDGFMVQQVYSESVTDAGGRGSEIVGGGRGPAEHDDDGSEPAL